MLYISKHILQRLYLNGKYVVPNSYLVNRRLHAEAQTHRGLVAVQGEEAAPFLQGLVTNDVNHLEHGATSMYSMFLNTQGRVLFDSVIYKKDEAFLIECDACRVQQLMKHLKMYRVRRKISIDCVDKDYCVWSLFDTDINWKDITPMDMDSLYMNPKSESEVSIKLNVKHESDMLVTRDSRLRYLGHRVIASVNADMKDVLPSIEASKGLFKDLRYKLGVSEGMEEIPYTKAFPLEANCDYLHGVSFHKGCYIGQELTARTFHTGVVRKRYMPLSFSSDASDLPFDVNVLNEKGKAVGKVRGICGQVGIGLMRIEECLAAHELKAEGFTVQTYKPAWWPYEASKERAK
ncbi:Iron-sulfur clusters incorporation protein [Halocaridina rubra]|uniref:Iron-sulfur clusters incorporation protein n=1 Tax=Halocaridina rubra TaxID=373956 RepID=A0AAN8X4H8_HALRR